MSTETEDRSTNTWVEAIEPTTRKLKVASVFADGVHFNAKGAAAVYEMMTDMAKRLDTYNRRAKEARDGVRELEKSLLKAHHKLIEIEVAKTVTPKVTAREVFLHIAYLTVIIWLTTS